MNLKKVFVATRKDQYVQDTMLPVGKYVFHAYVKFTGSGPAKYAVSFKDQNGSTETFDLSWQLEKGEWCKVSQEVDLARPVTQVSIMAATLSAGEEVRIGLPQHEEGSTISTKRANPLDEEEERKDEDERIYTEIDTNFDILEGLISAKVSQTDYNSDRQIINQSLAQLNIRADSIEQSVSQVENGLATASSQINQQANQINLRVTKAEYDADKILTDQAISQINQKADQIDISVKGIQLGMTNLLRNYNGDLGLDFWSLEFDSWEQGGFSGYNTQNNVKKIRTDFIDIEPGKYNVELSDDYKVQVLFYNSSKTGVQNNQNKINGDSVTAGSTVRYVRFALERVDGEDLVPADYEEAAFKLTMGTVISDSGDAVLPHIVSISLPQNSYSVQKDGTLTPNTSITLNLSNGTIRQTTINWGSINTGTVGTFTHNSSNYTIPSGVAPTPKPVASITINVTAGAPELTVASVVQPTQVVVTQYGTPLMPSTIVLNISDGTTRTVPVTWGSYNTNTVGTYNISGSYNLPVGIVGSKPAVSVSLKVEAGAPSANVIDILALIEDTIGDKFNVGNDSGGRYIYGKTNYGYQNNVYPAGNELSDIDNSYTVYIKFSYYLSGQTNVSILAGYSSDYNNPGWRFELETQSNRNVRYMSVTGGAGFRLLVPIGIDLRFYNIEARNDGLIPSWYSVGETTDVIAYLKSNGIAQYTSGSDSGGSYISLVPQFGSENERLFNGLEDKFVPGAKLYVRYSYSGEGIATIQEVNFLWRLSMPSGTLQASSTNATTYGAGISAFAGSNLKYYNIEIRSDGTVPNWF